MHIPSHEHIHALLTAYGITASIESVSPHGNGLINQTTRVETSEGRYIVQAVNTRVFPHISALENNISLAKQYGGKTVPIIFPLRNQENTIHTEYHGVFYRIFPYQENTESFDRPPTKSHLEAASRAFGQFTAAFDSAPKEAFLETIPHFHHLPSRYHDYMAAQKESTGVHSDRFVSLAHRVEALTFLVDIYTKAEKELPKRILHHDTKINNILFQHGMSAVAGIIDLDTIMPGLIFSDVGDMIRATLAFSDASDVRVEDVIFDADIHDTMMRAYIAGMGEKSLTDAEIHALPYSVPIIAFMLALRFLADFLRGNTYFRVSYDTENLDRAEKQIRIAEGAVQTLYIS